MFFESSLRAAFIVLSMGLVCRGFSDEVHYESDWKLESWNDRLPGFKARLTPQGFKFVSSMARTFLWKEIPKINIPNIHGTMPDKPVSYDATSLRISQYSIGSLNVIPVHGYGAYGVQLTVKGASVTVIGNWHYIYSGFPHREERGKFLASARGIYLGLPIKVGVDTLGRLNVRTMNCGFNVGDFELELDGASWILRRFKDKIVEAIKESLRSETCSKVRSKVDGDVASKLKNLQMVVPIKDIAVLDYSLVAAPKFNEFNYSVETSHKGEVYPIDSREECPLIIPFIPPEPDNPTTHILQMWITDYLPNSAGYALQKAGVLQYNVTSDNVPEAQKKYFNTSNFFFKRLFPQISKMYPDVLIQLNLNSTKAPECIVAPDGIQAVFVGHFSPYAILQNGSLAFLFTLEVTISADVNVSTLNNSLVWKISSMSTKISLVRSAVGKIDPVVLEKEINLAIRLYFIKQLNDYGATGIALPQMEGFSLSNPELTLGESYVKIETDLKYSG